MKNTILEDIKRLKSIADIGLLYAKDGYDTERYTELLEISHRMLAEISNTDVETLKASFKPVTEYPTAKVDVRALVLSANKKQILLARESADGKWSLPGGWADIGQSPKEVTEKEVWEETGLTVATKTLMAVFDKRLHPHPPQSFYVYKMVFHCEVISGELTKGFDVLDVQYFDINKLPELSTDRILESQIQLVYQKVIDNDFKAYFD